MTSVLFVCTGNICRSPTVESVFRALVARAGAKAHYVVSVGEWTARLRDGSTVWWSDARSLARRAQLARSLHLHGLAVWSLGLSDPITSARLNTPNHAGFLTARASLETVERPTAIRRTWPAARKRSTPA